MEICTAIADTMGKGNMNNTVEVLMCNWLLTEENSAWKVDGGEIRNTWPL